MCPPPLRPPDTIIMQAVESFEIQVPFTCIVVGPSGAGKSTFVRDFIQHQHTLLSRPFDYVYIFLGTPIEQNVILSSLQEKGRNVELIDFRERFIKAEPPPSVSARGTKWCEYFENYLSALLGAHAKKKQHGCIIFDDLMTELAECGLLIDLFTRVSSHSNVSVVHITQNLFYQGKRSGDNATLLRNTKLLVLFDSPMDLSSLNIVAQRTNTPVDFLRWVLKQSPDRWVAIRGDFNTPPSMRYTNGWFQKQPVPHINVYKLEDFEE